MDEKVRHVLERGLKKEIEAINFYLKNLQHFNYKENKKAVDELILDSFDHAKGIASELLRIRCEECGAIPSTLREAALEEERGMGGIYKFELDQMTPDVQSLFKKLIKEEAHHEKLVEGLKSMD